MATLIGWKIAASTSSLATTEFPFGSGLSVASDAAGRIYVGDSFYSRVQRYSRTGEFECGWPAATGSGVFVIQVNNQDQVEVASSHSGLFTYDSNGCLLSHVDRDLFTHYAARKATTPFRAEGGLLMYIIDTRNRKTIIAPLWPSV